MDSINYSDFSHQSFNHLEMRSQSQNMAVQPATTGFYGDNSDNLFADNAHLDNMNYEHAQLPLAPNSAWQFPYEQPQMQQFESQTSHHYGIGQLSAATNELDMTQSSEMPTLPFLGNSAQTMLPAQQSAAPNMGGNPAVSGSASHTCHLPDTSAARRDARMALCRHLVHESNGKKKQYDCSSVGQVVMSRCAEQYMRGNYSDAYKTMYRRAQKTESQRRQRS